MLAAEQRVSEGCTTDSGQLVLRSTWHQRHLTTSDCAIKLLASPPGWRDGAWTCGPEGVEVHPVEGSLLPGDRRVVGSACCRQSMSMPWRQRVASGNLPELALEWAPRFDLWENNQEPELNSGRLVLCPTLLRPKLSVRCCHGNQ